MIRLGILGGGQLGRMMALAAAPLGVKCHIFTPDVDSPAAQVTPIVTLADYDDQVALASFAASVDVITYEFENIPLASVRFLAALKPVYPSPETLAITQHRALEKNFINECGIDTVKWRGITLFAQLQALRQEWIGQDIILKTCQMGYDGKGQVKIPAACPDDEAERSWQELAKYIGGRPEFEGSLPPLIAEAVENFAAEASVMIARNAAGECQAYPMAENRHRNHVLAETIVPIRPELAPPALQDQAQHIAQTLAEKLDLVGILAVEMFLTQAGTILVNELAPRPHNSGHWSLDFCLTSQFEQTVRAVSGLPLGGVDILYPAGYDASNSQIIMQNLLGDDLDHWPHWLKHPLAKLHLYGKGGKMPGRKMGHVTRCEKI
ncbi:MAG: 5-(carboxyamino)imidazole ribonucleotide synthase [Candidatus Symbiobacter sp.]|nr:5-(carboxyamino)imidazole ribonucleotide synthase [Candidatus Symbiobacter sp.]